MKSRVHPRYKTKYRVGNWPSYDRALVQRGDITMWISQDAIDAWKPRLSRKRGGQKRYSDTEIETALTLRLVFNLVTFFRYSGPLPPPDPTSGSPREDEPGSKHPFGTPILSNALNRMFELGRPVWRAIKS